MKDLQQSYIQLSEIKQRDEDRRNAVIHKQQVESIINNTLPKLKQSINDMTTTIKQLLPPDMRAAYESAYQQALPRWGDIVQECIDEINDLI